MALTNPWILVAVAGVAAAAILLGLLWPDHPARGPGGAPVARAERIRALPAVRRANRMRAVVLITLLALGAVAALAAGAVAARPMAQQQIVPEHHSRDIMLCLDVSGSMSEVDVEVLNVFDELIDGFEGERLGLTIFNSSPVQAFPLTDDYGFVRDRIASLRASIERGTTQSGIPEHWAGTLDGPGSSLIGDGLAACALRFDHSDEERSRSVILATDNEAVGASIVTLEQAAAYSAERGIRVFALNPIQDGGTDRSSRLSAAASATGGAAYALRGSTTVAEIIDQVQREDARAISARSRIVWSDAPAPWIIALVAASGAALVIAWRVRA